jgi:hypothetical protein
MICFDLASSGEFRASDMRVDGGTLKAFYSPCQGKTGVKSRDKDLQRGFGG